MSAPFSNFTQESVFKLLLKRAGAGPAALYLDTCTIRSIDLRWQNARSVIAHLFREVVSGIRERVVPIQSIRCSECGSVQRDVGAQKAAIKASGAIDSGKLESLSEGLHRLAHRVALEKPLPIDDTFLTQVERIDQDLEIVLQTITGEDLDVTAGFELVTRVGELRFPERDDIAITAEREVYAALENRIAPAAAAWYLDAVTLRQPELAFLISRAILIGHALRETESALRRVLSPFDLVIAECASCGQEISRHLQQVRAILRIYDVPGDHASAEAWERIATEGGFARYAHAPNLDVPRRFESEMETLFSSVTGVFGEVLSRYEHAFSRYVLKLDELLATKNPSKKDAKAFRNDVPQTFAIHDYFFTRAQSPGWLQLLRGAEVFRVLPEPIRSAEGFDLFRWSQGEYLLRLLRSDTRHANDVVPLLTAALSSANPRVHQVIAEAASLITREQRRDIADGELQWLRDQSYIDFLLAEQIMELSVALANDGDEQRATDLAREVLRIDSSDGNARIVTDRLAYELFLEHFVARLPAASCVRALTTLCDVLDDFLAATREEASHTHSWIWRQAIEEHETNLRGGLRDALINSVREIAIRVAQSSGARVVVELLEGRHKEIYDRIALHIIRVTGDIPLAVERLTNPEVIESQIVWHEVTMLLRSLFASFTIETREAIDALSSQHAPLDRPEFLVWTEAKFVQPRSPLTLDQLRQLGADDVLRYVRDWVAPRQDDFFSFESRNALASELESMVKERPLEFAQRSRAARGLHVSYVRAILQALHSAVGAGPSFDWLPVLDLVEWVFGQTRGPSDHQVVSPTEEESSWLFARNAVCDLLQAGMRAREADIPMSNAPRLLELVRQLALDPDPTPSDDASLTTIDAAAAEGSLALRPRAMSLAVQMARWLVHAGSGAYSEIVNELLSVVDERLDPVVENSPAVRAAIGRAFTHLLWLNEPWAIERTQKIFDATDPALAAAAWAGYLSNGVSEKAFDALREHYRRAAAAMDSGEVQKNLAAHLVLLYWNGHLTLAPDDMLVAFMARADAHTRYDLLHTVAQLLPDQGGESVAVARSMSLWEWRSKLGDAAELEAFENWVLSRRFPVRWALLQLESLATAGQRFFRFTLIIEWLREVATSEPAQAARTLRALITAEKDETYLNAARHDVRRILNDVRISAPDDARITANILTKRGLHDFKNG